VAEQLLADAAPATPSARADAAVLRVAFDPMVGLAAGDALVLYRTVLVGQRGYRQGLVLDRAALGAWLDERVIRSTGLTAVAELRFAAGSSPADAERYTFAHRFAEPFDALSAELVLASLPGVGTPEALYVLVAVLLAVGAAGVFAVHRTAAVVMHYADRRSNFAAAVTHELKTPLTAIRMYAEMLRDGLVPSEAKRHEYYATITGESERLSRLVDNVLEFSKLEGGRRELAIAVGMVGPVLADAAEKLAPHAAREGFTLAVRVADDLPAVRFDRDALLQVLFNLVDNAMKYAKGSRDRTVELEARREGEAVTVAVRDFGPGVARAHLERVFEPFYRGESELTRTTKGTGIGLALVKELAERMGAAVTGANAEGGGFRVRLAFPVG
jgi:signal transduction histidine kinase